MADNVTFDAAVDLKLVKCSSFPPFSESSTFEGLNGVSHSNVEVVPGVDKVSIEVPNSNQQELRLLVLRPLSVKLDVQKAEKGSWEEGGHEEVWMDVDKAGFSRDALANWLGYQAEDSKCLALGRVQYYFDGLLTLLNGKEVDPLELKFSLKDKVLLDAKGAPVSSEAAAKKKLLAVLVQYVAGYAKRSTSQNDPVCGKDPVAAPRPPKAAGV